MEAFFKSIHFIVNIFRYIENCISWSYWSVWAEHNSRWAHFSAYFWKNFKLSAECTRCTVWSPNIIRAVDASKQKIPVWCDIADWKNIALAGCAVNNLKFLRWLPAESVALLLRVLKWVSMLSNNVCDNFYFVVDIDRCVNRNRSFKSQCDWLLKLPLRVISIHEPFLLNYSKFANLFKWLFINWTAVKKIYIKKIVTFTDYVHTKVNKVQTK